MTFDSNLETKLLYLKIRSICDSYTDEDYVNQYLIQIELYENDRYRGWQKTIEILEKHKSTDRNITF
jgi:hypothetical protein